MIDFKTIRTGDKVKVVGDSSWKDAVGIVICKNDVNESFLVSLDKDNLRISFFENELAKVGDSMRSIEELKFISKENIAEPEYKIKEMSLSDIEEVFCNDKDSLVWQLCSTIREIYSHFADQKAKIAELEKQVEV